MKPINAETLYKLLNGLTVANRTTDRSEYTIPKDKLLLLDWGTPEENHITNIAGVMIHDGAGAEGNQMLLELFGSDDEVVFDAFFDYCPFNLDKRLKLIDNPF